MIARLLKKRSKIRSYLFEPVSSTPLGFFRILWGCVMLYHFYTLTFVSGKVLYLDTIFHFKYPFFEWVDKLPPNGIILCFYIGLISSVFMLLGLYYKTSSKLLFIVYTYIFLLDVSYWNNHYYAYMLINAFFMFTDGHKSFSLDKKRLNLDGHIPQWQLLLFQFQIMIIYFYGGLSKLQNKDWMENVSGYALIRAKFGEYNQYVYPISIIVTYGGLLYDLTLPFLLKWKKTLWLSLLLILSFNISNHFLFNIGSFPFAMIASFVLFIPGKLIVDKLKLKEFRKPDTTSLFQKKITLFFLLLFVFFQLVAPFRSWFIKGNVFWTSEGKLFAWHMMSSSNRVAPCKFYILEYDENKKVLQKQTSIDATKFLNSKQIRRLIRFPKVIPQFAKFLKEESELAGFKNVAVTASLLQSKNQREYHYMVDPDVDLSSVEVFHFKHNPWILLYKTEEGY